MARRTAVQLNRGKLNELQLAIADGLLNVAHDIALEASANAPDADEGWWYAGRGVRGGEREAGAGLVNRWGAAAYVGGKKVGDVSGDGSVVNKPRAFKATGGLEAIVGFGFGGRFQEMGTAHHAAQPFLTPAAIAVLPNAPALMREGAAPRLRKP